MLKGPKTFWAPLPPKNTLYLYVFTFYCIFMLNLDQKFTFTVKKRDIFLKKAPSAPNFGRLAPKILPPQPRIFGGDKPYLLPTLGVQPPRRPPLTQSLGQPPLFGAEGAENWVLGQFLNPKMHFLAIFRRQGLRKKIFEFKQR